MCDIESRIQEYSVTMLIREHPILILIYHLSLSKLLILVLHQLWESNLSIGLKKESHIPYFQKSIGLNTQFLVELLPDLI